MIFVLILCAALALLVLLVSFVCVRMVFAVPAADPDKPKFPRGKQYLELEKEILALVSEASALEYEHVYIRSSEGLRLHAKLYLVDEKAPCHILFHGYRSSALLDFGGGLRDTVKSGHNALLVDQRAHGRSEGRYLSFGINESRDCLEWIDYANQRLGTDKPVIIEGVSMGAATVLMAAGLELPENVIAVLADSPYSSPEKIIRHVMRQRHYPAFLFAFIRLGGRLFCGFDISSESPLKAVESCRVPVFFIHGDDDRFVPYGMGRELFDACPADKLFFTGSKAGHALSYLVDTEGYRKAHREFMDKLCI